MKIKILTAAWLMASVGWAGVDAATVTVTMNAVSTTMTLAPKGGDANVEVGTPASKVYTFDAPAGDYVLTAYATNGTTVNGTIELTVGEENVDFAILTCTAYASNKDADGNAWTIANGDYSLEVNVNSRDGAARVHTIGNSTTANRYTFLALKGDSYTAKFVPSEAHAAEGYGPLYKSGTLTANANVYGAIPLMEDYSITIPKDATLEVGMKFTHFIDFTIVEPKSVEVAGDNTVVTYTLAQGQVYNYRTWREGGLTQAGYFTMSANAADRPAISFTDADYNSGDPKQVNHDVQSNNGLESGDIFVNINKEGHLDLAVGDTFKAHAMRSWELTDGVTNNYFIEPDFHYTVVGLDGKPSADVVEISQKPGSAWADIKAVGAGTAIVLVTYDAIKLNYYSGATKKEFYGGEYWGAIWPENTAAYVVTVGQGAVGVTPEFKVNEGMNDPAKKLAGDAVDAEHDVFYFLATADGYPLTFKAEGAASVSVAYPTVGAQMASYSGFGEEGVAKNADGTYTVVLKEGRNIVRIADAAGKAVYQVLTAKSCSVEVVNVGRPGSTLFQPGDEIKVQYSGLRHPANKMAGIYNMTGSVVFGAVPEGATLTSSTNQYAYGSTAAAQAVSVAVAADYDVSANPTLALKQGVIQVSGFGDPIGNHRATDPVGGRSANFSAISHKTYFGALPEVAIALQPMHMFDIAIDCNAAGAEVEVSYKGVVLAPGDNGHYSGTYGDYAVVAKAAGYCCYRSTFTISEGDADAQTFKVVMEQVEGAWDGTSQSEPTVNADGQYVIATAAELAWFAAHVNAAGANHNAAIVADLHLGNYDWTPIGTASATSLNGTITGGGHRIDGLYVNSTASNVGLVGYAKGTADAPIAITGLTVGGSVTAKSNVGGVVGYMTTYVTVDTCANYAAIVSTNSGAAGGVVGYKSSNCNIANSYNAGTVSSAGYHGGILGNGSSATTLANVFNVGAVEDNAKANACFGAASATLTGADTNAFAIADCTNTYGYTLVTEQQMASGEVAYRLGDAFGQELGVDPYPTFGGPAVYYDEATGTYTNRLSAIDDIVGSGLDASPTLYYNLQGVASPTPWRGVNIVRLANGSVKKALIR